MKPADVRIESDRGVYLFRPETDRGREWLGANGQAGRWMPGGLLVESPEQAQALVIRLAEAGLEVTAAPAEYLRWCQKTDNRGWLH